MPLPSWALPVLDWVTAITLTLLVWSFIPVPARRAMWRALGWLGQGGIDTWYAILGRERPMPGERRPARPAPPRPAPAPARPAPALSAPSARGRIGYLPSRSARVQARSSRSNAFSTRSARPDAETAGVQRSRSAFAVPPIPAESVAHDPRLPQNVDELQRLARAIIVHARSQRGAKQKGILEAWGVRPGAGPEWERASALFDLAVPKAEARPDLLDDLKMEPVP